MAPLPYVPVDRACPACGSEAWGLKGSLTGPPVAACYPQGHERPLRLLVEDAK